MRSSRASRMKAAKKLFKECDGAWEDHFPDWIEVEFLGVDPEVFARGTKTEGCRVIGHAASMPQA